MLNRLVLLLVLLLIFAPSDAAQSRKQVGPRGPSGAPPIPYEDVGACPGECCQYGLWTTLKAKAIQRDRRPNSPVAFHVRKGEKLTALTGVVVITNPGQVKVVKPITLGGLRTRVGDIVYVLTPLGEGYCKVWLKGKVIRSVDLEGKGFQSIRPLEMEWWVKVKNSKGQIGWTIFRPGDFDGNDACG